MNFASYCITFILCASTAVAQTSVKRITEAIGRAVQRGDQEELEKQINQINRLYLSHHPIIRVQLSQDAAYAYRHLTKPDAAAKAKEWFERGKRDLARATGHPAYGRTGTWLYLLEGRFYEEQRDFDAALAAFQKAVELRCLVPYVWPQGNPVDLGELYEEVINCLQKLDRLDDAIPTLQAALRFWSSVRAAADPAIAQHRLNTLSHVSKVSLAAGDLEAAMRALSECRELRRRHPTLSASSLPVPMLETLADLADLRGEPSRALPLREEAAAMRATLPDIFPAEEIQADRKFAATLDALGRHDEALVIHRRALEAFESLGGQPRSKHLEHLQNLAWCELQCRQVDACRETLDRMKQLRKADRAVATPAELMLRAEFHLADGDPTGVLDCLRMARSLTPPDDTARHQDIHMLRAALYEARGDSEGALTESKKAYELVVAQDTASPNPQLVTVAARHATLMLRTDAPPAEVVTVLERAQAALATCRADAASLDPVDRARYLATLQKVDVHAALALAHWRNGDAAAAVLALESGRARTTLELLSRGYADATAAVERHARTSKDAEVQARVRDIQQRSTKARQAIAAALVKLRTDGASAAEAKQAQVDLDTARSRFRGVERERAALLAEHADRNAKAAVAKPKGRLGRGEALAYWSFNTIESFMLLVPKSGKPALHVLRDKGGKPVSAERINEQILQCAAVVSPTDTTTRGETARRRAATGYPRIAKELFDVLVPADAWRSVVKHKRIYVVPDGELYRLPLDALVVSNRGGKPKYWLDDGPAVAIAPSASVLARCQLARRKAKRKKYDVVAFGDVDFSRRTSDVASEQQQSAFKRLPWSGDEVRTIFGLFEKRLWSEQNPGRNARAFLQAKATERNAYEFAPNAEILHIATHFCPDKSPGALRSGLVLSQTEIPDEVDDGLLTLEELLTSWSGRLAGSKLVVLSACESSIGEQNAGEGVLGAPLGFLAAGAPAVMATTTLISDATTADLMSQFYFELTKRRSGLEALQNARRMLRKAGKPVQAWGPFVWIGAN